MQNAVVEYLWPLAPGGARGDGWAMGLNVNANELQTRVARVAGVRTVKAVSLFQKITSGTTTSWQRLAKTTPLSLLKYQLPELMGVSVSTANGDPELPTGIEPLATGSGVPAPVIPEVC